MKISTLEIVAKSHGEILPCVWDILRERKTWTWCPDWWTWRSRDSRVRTGAGWAPPGAGASRCLPAFPQETRASPEQGQKFSKFPSNLFLVCAACAKDILLFLQKRQAYKPTNQCSRAQIFFLRWAAMDTDAYIPLWDLCHCWDSTWSGSTPACVVWAVWECGASEKSPWGRVSSAGSWYASRTCAEWWPLRFRTPWHASGLDEQKQMFNQCLISTKANEFLLWQKERKKWNALLSTKIFVLLQNWHFEKQDAKNGGRVIPRTRSVRPSSSKLCNGGAPAPKPPRHIFVCDIWSTFSDCDKKQLRETKTNKAEPSWDPWSECLCLAHWTAETQTSDEHGNDGENLLGVGVGRHVAEPDTGETSTGEVQRRDVGTRVWRLVDRSVDDRLVQTLRQLIQPAYELKPGKDWGTHNDTNPLQAIFNPDRKSVQGRLWMPHLPTVQFAGFNSISFLPMKYQTQASQWASTVNIAIKSVRTTKLQRRHKFQIVFCLVFEWEDGT